MRASLRSALTAVVAVAFTAGVAGAQVGKSQGVQDINTASEAAMAAMPHLNAALAKEIVARRPFLSMADVDAFLAAKLTKEQRTALYPKLFLHINLNTATREEILMVPGIGARMLREFLEYRPYKAMAQFNREMGKYVKEDEVARMAQYVFVPIDLNTASDEDILSIPGMGPRMLREFKEYRPYKAMAQFEREMGKYVDAKEVARLARYVEIR
jgi:DNA uptake protein ComE-like DNA-binding protein